jgi:outer membrane cobalamin receptor
VSRTGTVACLLLVAAAAPAAAQLAAGEIRVTVRDASGLPMISSGLLTSDSAQTERRFTTDAAGRFTFDRLPFGVYRLVVDAPGFSTRTEIVDVRSAVPREVRVTLVVAPIAASVNVAVEPPALLDQHRVGVSFDVSTRQIREQQSSTPGRELLDVVNAQPGWLMESNGVLHPRGSEYQTLFVVDGVPMEDNRSPAFAPELPDGSVEAISILTGTFPAEYGRKLGGVVDVTTSRDRRTGFHGAADAGGGSFGMATGFASGTYGWERRSLSVAAGLARTDRYLDPPTEANDANAGSLGSLSVSFDAEPTARDRVQLAWRGARARFLAPNDFVQQAAGQRQDRRSADQTAQVAWSRVLAPQLLLSVRGSVADLSAEMWSNASSTPIIVAQQRGFTRTYVKAALSAQAGVHDLKVGTDIVHAPVDEALQYQIADMSFFNPQTPESFSFVDRRTDREAAVFAQDTIRAGSLTASLGLRWDRYKLVVDDAAISPRLGVAWAVPSSEIVLRASYDRAFQTPAIENLLLASSSAVDQLNRQVLRLPVPASRGDFLEAGVSAAIAKTARLDATVYRRTFSNFADDDVFLNTGVSFPIAFRSGDVRGVDVKLTLPKWGAFASTASYSWLLGRADLPVTGGFFLGADAATSLIESRVPISQDQRHTIRARVRHQTTARLWTAAAGRYGSGLPVELDEDPDIGDLTEHYGPEVVGRVDFEARRLRANLAIDFGAGIEVWRRGTQRLEVRGEVANLTDHLNVVNFTGLFSGTAVAPPRSATIRARLEF